MSGALCLRTGAIFTLDASAVHFVPDVPSLAEEPGDTDQWAWFVVPVHLAGGGAVAATLVVHLWRHTLRVIRILKINNY